MLVSDVPSDTLCVESLFVVSSRSYLARGSHILHLDFCSCMHSSYPHTPIALMALLHSSLLLYLGTARADQLSVTVGFVVLRSCKSHGTQQSYGRKRHTTEGE